MKTFTFSIRISKDQYLSYYSGAVKDVVTRATNGQTIRFPARHLQPFVTHDGIEGVFAMEIDDNNRFQSIKRIQ